MRQRIFDSFIAYWRWKKSNIADVLINSKQSGNNATRENISKEDCGINSTLGLPLFSFSSFFASSSSLPPTDSSSLDAVKSVVQNRRSCKRFDSTRTVDLNLVDNLLAMTVRAPTSLNLQPWVAIVVHETKQREALSHAALGQLQPRDAPVSVVFAGDMEPEKNAPAVLEMGLECGYYHPLYGATFLRHVYYLLHGGSLGSLACAKSVISSLYSHCTGVPVLSVPTNMQAYAWKQTMIPATTFLYLATSAGFDTSVIEGFDEAEVRRLVGLPSRFTVPVIISVGHGTKDGFHSVCSPRFPTRHLIRWNKF